MVEKLKRYYNQGLEKLKILDKTQKTRLALISIGVILALIFTIYFVLKPKMAVLYSGLSYEDVAQVQTALNDAGIENNAVEGGTAIEVPEKDANEAKISLAKVDIPASGTFAYQDALDASGMGTTESVKIQNFKRVKESDIAESLKMFGGVHSARVQLVIPEENNYFVKSDEEASAGIVLQTNGPINAAMAESIARYVSQSVKGLSTQNIEIIDQDGASIYSGTAQSEGGLSTNGYDLELARKAEIEGKIRGSLAPLYNEVKIMSNLVLNMDKAQVKDKTYTSPVQDSATGLVSEEISEKQNMTGGTQGEEPGLNANDNATTTYEMGAQTSSSSSANNKKTDYLHNEQESITDKSTGDINTEESSLSVMVYKYKNYDQELLEENGTLDNTTWEAYKTDNSAHIPIVIEPETEDAVRLGTGIDDVKIVGYEVPVFYDKIPVSLKIEQLVMFGILALLLLLLAFGLLKRSQLDEITEIEPELSVEDLLVTTKLEAQREKEIEAEKMKDIDFAKESETKRQIEKFVNDKPDAVAQLLRNWLNDDWE